MFSKEGNGLTSATLKGAGFTPDIYKYATERRTAIPPHPLKGAGSLA